jgi:GNAT superfamily N-acetyltransferase
MSPARRGPQTTTAARAAAIEAQHTTDAASALADASEFLATRPVEHNLVLTILHERVRSGAAGRYWIVRDAGEVRAVALQSPVGWSATATPCTRGLAIALASSMAATVGGDGAAIELPGFGAEAATAAWFAGEWTERRAVAALPREGQRLYQLTSLVEPTGVPGRLRVAETHDRARLLPWMLGFVTDTRQDRDGVDALLDSLLDTRRLSIWEVHGEPVSMCSATAPVAGVVRIAAVYTPPSQRGHGYASVAVAALSARVLDAGCTAALYTDLGNTVSNAIYRRLGYEAVQELVRYRFGDDASVW